MSGNTQCLKMKKKYLHTKPDNNLLVLDVGKNFSAEDPHLFKQIRKTDPNVPRALNEHALWYSKTLNKIYQLGGWASSIGDRGRDSPNLAEVPSPGIWEFDIVSERWTKADDEFDKRNTGDKIERSGSASYCDAPSLGVSFLFEGYVQQRSDKEYANYAPSSDVKCWCSSSSIFFFLLISVPSNMLTDIVLDRHQWHAGAGHQRRPLEAAADKHVHTEVPRWRQDSLRPADERRHGAHPSWRKGHPGAAGRAYHRGLPAIWTKGVWRKHQKQKCKLSNLICFWVVIEKKKKKTPPHTHT